MYDLYKPICGLFTFDVGIFPYCDNRLDGMRWDNHWDFILSFIYECAIKVEVYVTFLYEGSIYTRYDYILYVCRGLCKPPSRC